MGVVLWCMCGVSRFSCINVVSLFGVILVCVGVALKNVPCAEQQEQFTKGDTGALQAAPTAAKHVAFVEPLWALNSRNGLPKGAASPDATKKICAWQGLSLAS